jgi:hypothetical protein
MYSEPSARVNGGVVKALDGNSFSADGIETPDKNKSVRLCDAL